MVYQPKDSSNTSVVLIEKFETAPHALDGQLVAFSFETDKINQCKVDKPHTKFAEYPKLVGYLEESSWSSNLWFYPLDQRVIRMKATKNDQLLSKIREKIKQNDDDDEQSYILK